MIFVRLFALALLLHENTGLLTQGRSYFRTCFVPAFGLSLPPGAMVVLHGSLVALCLVLLAAPALWPLYPLLLLALTLLIASYSLRLSNHLIAAWVMCLLLCVDLLFQTPARRGLAPTSFFLSGTQIVVGLVYALAFLHKLNPEYLSPEMSCGSFLGCDYLKSRVNITHPRLLKIQSYLSIYGILGLEGAIPVLLLFPVTRPLGLLCAVLLHLPLAFIGNAHFAGLMYAGLSAFVAPDSWPRLLHSAFAFSLTKRVGLVLLGLYLGHRFGGYGYRRRVPAYGQQLFYGVYFAAALVVSLALLRAGPLPATFSWGGPAAHGLLLVLLAAFLLNGLAPYLGLKTNFSFAMFSNLRPVPWRHLLWRAEWRPFHFAHYIQIEAIHGVPPLTTQNGGKEWSDALRPALETLTQPDQWLYSDYFFHEALRLLCRTGLSIQVTYTQNGRRFEVQDYAQEAAAHPPRYRRLGLFPYTLPRDPSVRHCN